MKSPLVFLLVCAALLPAQTLDEAAAAHWTNRAAKVASLKTPADVKARQQFIRKWLEQAVGGFPRKTPLNARITGSLERDGYRIEKLVFESLPDFYVTAAVYVPTTGAPPFPAVLGVAGHSDTGKAVDTYQHAWLGLVKRGFVVLAFDPPGQGERLEYIDPETGKSKVGVGVPEHIMAGLQCLLTGTTIARYEIWDGIRAFDYLLTRKDVDPKRIAVAGNSGGGTQAAYLAVLEPRLASAVTSCYITSWETLWAARGPQDSEQVFPNFLRDGLDFGDFLIAFAPKPILMTTAIQDFFPIEGARATYAEVDRVYKTADAPGRAGYFEFDDPHGWSKPRREAAYRWLTKWLQGREDDSPEAEVALEPAANLNASPTGQVATSYKGETVHSLNLKLAEELYAKRPGRRVSPAELRRMIRSRLVIEAAPTPEIKEFRPEAVPTGALLWVGTAEDEEIHQHVQKGELVLALRPRGYALPSKGRGYTQDYQTAMRALMVGKTMLGMQVSDALAAYEHLRLQTTLPVRIAGRGNAAWVALLAGALEPGIVSVDMIGAPESWMDIARVKIHSGVAALIVPGVLRDFDIPDVIASMSPRPVKRTP